MINPDCGYFVVSHRFLLLALFLLRLGDVSLSVFSDGGVIFVSFGAPGRSTLLVGDGSVNEDKPSRSRADEGVMRVDWWVVTQRCRHIMGAAMTTVDFRTVSLRADLHSCVFVAATGGNV